MKTTISIWNKDDDVLSIYHDEDNGINFLPLSKGDKFYMDFDELFPVDINNLRKQGYKDEFIYSISDDYEEKRKKYGYGQWKVVSVYKSFRKHFQHETVLVVEYQIKKVRKIYWRFWRLYKWKQFWKNLFKK